MPFCKRLSGAYESIWAANALGKSHMPAPGKRSGVIYILLPPVAEPSPCLFQWSRKH